MKHKTSNCDKTQTVTKHKMWQLKLWRNSKTQIVTKLKPWQNSKCDNSNWDQTQKLKLQENSTTQMMTKLKKSNCDNSKLKLWQNLYYDKFQFMTRDTLKGSFSKNFLTPWQPMRCSLGSLLWFSQCFFLSYLQKQ